LTGTRGKSFLEVREKNFRGGGGEARIRKGEKIKKTVGKKRDLSKI